MTRGLPAVWSSVFGAPFVAVGTYVFAFQFRYPLVTDQPTVPPMAGVPLILFGLFVVGLGLYVRFVGTPDGPTMRDDEWVVDERNPAQRSALVKAFSSVPFLAVGLDLLYLTTHPLVYPTAALAVGFYLFSTGIHEYWRNTLTGYLVTNRRVIEEYRFVSLVRNEIPLGKVRAVRERRSVVDTLLGLGNVRIRAGATGDLSVTVRSVYESTEFADEIRREMDRTEQGAEYVDTRTDSTRADTAAELDADGRADVRSDADTDEPVEWPSTNDSKAAAARTEPLNDGGTAGSVPGTEERAADRS